MEEATDLPQETDDVNNIDSVDMLFRKLQLLVIQVSVPIRTIQGIPHQWRDMQTV